MESASKKSWVSGTVVRKLFPEVEDHSVDALTAVWDEVVDRIISEMRSARFRASSPRGFSGRRN